jgi:hypothetical protein
MARYHFDFLSVSIFLFIPSAAVFEASLHADDYKPQHQLIPFDRKRSIVAAGPIS